LIADLLTQRQKHALHESAHSVLAELEHISIWCVLLDPPEIRIRPAVGWAMSEDDEHRFTPTDAGDPMQRSQIAPYARVALAGAVIEGACFGEIDPANKDIEKATELVLAMGLFMDEHGDRAGDYLDRLERQTIRMLADNWGAVTEVAMALLEHGQLSGAEVRAIIAGKET
jgi:ATP-dependent Zn protease